MILAFHGIERANYVRIADRMFRLRAKVFHERLRWDVIVSDGWEIDEFDDLNPLYLVAMTQERVVGSLRLLPTTGPTLLSGPLAHLFDDNVDIPSPLIFECTRFATDDSASHMTSARVSRSTIELLMANCEIMLRSGVQQVMGVIDERTLPIYRRAGWVPSIVDRSTKAANIIVGLWEVSSDILRSMIERHGFASEIIMTQENFEYRCAS